MADPIEHSADKIATSLPECANGTPDSLRARPLCVDHHERSIGGLGQLVGPTHAFGNRCGTPGGVPRP